MFLYFCIHIVNNLSINASEKLVREGAENVKKKEILEWRKPPLFHLYLFHGNGDKVQVSC